MATVFAGGGETGALMATVDWAATALGPVSGWPASLCSVVSVCLQASFPAIVWWGPDLVVLHNDACRPLLEGHPPPSALGRPGSEIWPTLEPSLGRTLQDVARRDETIRSRDELLQVSRGGAVEAAYFILCSSPIHDGTGGVCGVFTTATETTDRVLGEHRLRTLSELAGLDGGARSDAEVCAGAGEALVRNSADVTFALLYLVPPGAREARLAWAPERLRGSAAAPQAAPLDSTAGGWPLLAARESGRATEVPDLVARFGRAGLDTGPGRPPSALVLPLSQPARGGAPRGFLIAGASSGRPVDEAYRSFLNVAAGQIASSLADVEAREAAAVNREARDREREQRRRVHELALMQDMARTLASTLEPRSVLEELALAASRIAAGPDAEDGSALVLRRSPDASITVAAAAGGDRGAFERALRRHVDYVLESGRPVQFTLGEVATEPERRHLAEAGIHSVAMVPIPAADERFGVMAIGGASDRPIPPHLIHRLALLADLGGLAMANATAYQREHRALETSQERLRELTLLHEATRTFSSTLSLEAIEAEVVRSATRLVAAEGPPLHAIFLRTDGETATVVHEDDRRGRHTGATFPVSAHPPIAEALARRRAHAVAVRDLRLGAAALRRGVFELSATHIAFAPVFAQDEPYGIVAVMLEDERGFDRELPRRLEAIANLAELAIGNARHFESVRREGERVAALEDVKSKFLRLASHELRSPLAVLRGYLSMLEDGTYAGRPDELPAVYTILSAKAGQMDMLVTQMLEAARLEEGRLRMDLRLLDLRQPAGEAFEGARLTARPSHELELVLPGEPVEVVADAWRVTTIVANLLDNAIKYSPDGGPVRCTVRAVPGSAVVEVADRGLGVAESDLPVLFTRFGRIVTADNSHIQGTGLGLYLSRELAHMQGGTLTAVSRPGMGSTFTLIMPLATAHGGPSL
ncbi:MAG TPA: HAMP domain-containing sensor histidine kinase [Candidatus Dormibacteraeota bacterium]